MESSDYLIIGNSTAGLAAVEGIRELDPAGSITLLSEEKFFNYSKPLISYYLSGKIGLDRIRFREESFYKENNVTLLLEHKAVRLIEKTNTAVLSNRREIRFKKLLLATGGVPIIPPIEGFSKNVEGVFTFTTLEDALKLKEYIEANAIKEAVVLGAGLIGLKASEGLLLRGIKVTVVELADRILANTFDLKGSTLVERYLAKNGSNIIKQDTITAVKEENGKLKSVRLKSGPEIETKCLVAAVGVRPNVSLAADTGITVNRGMVVNDLLETGSRDIYAAGDTAEAPEFFERKNALIAIWPLAARTGKIAGMNMAGGKRKFTGLFPMNSVQILELPTISFGITEPKTGGCTIREIHRPEINQYRKLVIKDNRLIGAVLVGDIDRAGIYGLLIKEKINVEPFEEELLSENFGLLVLPKEFRKHAVTGDGIEV